MARVSKPRNQALNQFLIDRSKKGGAHKSDQIKREKNRLLREVERALKDSNRSY